MQPFPPVRTIDPREAYRLFGELPSNRALSRAKQLTRRTQAATIACSILFGLGLLNLVVPFIDAFAGFLTTCVLCGLLILQSRAATKEIVQIKDWILAEPKVSSPSKAWLLELQSAQTNEVARLLAESPKIEADVSALCSSLVEEHNQLRP
jgi:hypothetical protein